MNNQLKLYRPASWWAGKWREALPVGNGHIGASVYGAIDPETIMLTHEDLWNGTWREELPSIVDQLPVVRQMLLDNRPQEAEKVMEAALRERGYNPRWPFPLPLADVKLFMPVKEAFKNYERTLDMETGEVLVSWNDSDVRYQRALFVSRTDDMVVCEIRSSKAGSINLSVTLGLHDPSDAKKPFGEPEGFLPSDAQTIAHEGGYVCYSARNDDGRDFGVVAKVVATGGNAEPAGGSVRVSGADSVLVYMKLFIKSTREQEWARLKEELAGENRSYASLFQPHAEAHGKLFRTVEFSIGATADEHALSNEELLLQAYKGENPNALVEKMWSYGRYLLISSSREGGHPCPLQGLWCGEYDGMWTFNMVNENLEMIYWHALSGHLPELLLAVFDYVDALMEDFRTNARQLYGCRGIFIPPNTTPGNGLIVDLQRQLIHWTGGAAWIGQHYYDYYLHTQDVTFLRERAMPFLYETALFYEDFLILDDQGYYMSIPSTSPENSAGNYPYGTIKISINSTMDFALLKEVLTHLIEGAGITGTYLEHVDKWKNMLAHIPPYQINEDGAIAEYMHPFFKDNYNHRHQSHAYPLFPGHEITDESDPELYNAFVTAIEKRLVVGISAQCSWSLAHLACNYARLGNGNSALECLDILGRSTLMNNFFTACNDWRDMGASIRIPWAPFQIDANMGWTAAIQEMLLYSQPGACKLLPALPGKWRSGRIAGLLCRGGAQLDLAWNRDEQTVTVTLESPTDQQVSLRLPGVIEAVTGKAAAGTTMDGNRLSGVALHAGQRCELTIALKDWR